MDQHIALTRLTLTSIPILSRGPKLEVFLAHFSALRSIVAFVSQPSCASVHEVPQFPKKLGETEKLNKFYSLFQHVSQVFFQTFSQSFPTFSQDFHIFPTFSQQSSPIFTWFRQWKDHGSRALVGSDDGSLSLWRLESGECLARPWWAENHHFLSIFYR
jgi:hypothetical protein